MMQHALKLWIYLHPQDVGAVIDRPWAIDNRTYRFLRIFSLFCNRPFSCAEKLSYPCVKGNFSLSKILSVIILHTKKIEKNKISSKIVM